ncbi:MAG: amino acid adenylation domain-containing protein [Chitinophagaceae bacterium]
MTELNSKNVQNIYRLSPMQEGIYFHAIMDEGSDAYFCQNAYRVRMPLQNALLEKSLQQLVERHDVLRTVFSHEKTEHCIQVVLKKRLTGIFFEDISGLNDKEEYLQSFRLNDRKKGFDLSKDMLLRLAVIKMQENEYELVWSHHHIIMDGWCSSMLMQEFTQVYHSLKNGEIPLTDTIPQFGAYIGWLQSQDMQRAENFWKEYLKDFRQPTGLQSKAGIESRQPVFEEVELLLPSVVCDQLNELAVTLKLTPNTIYQSAWGIILSYLNHTNDVTFGAVVSSRPAEIKGIDRMLGLFINTLPVRISFNDNDTILSLLADAQRNALLCGQHQFFPLHHIQSLCEVKDGLIDHVFIMENFGSAFSGAEADKSGENEISFNGTFSQTNYNLNIIVLPGKQTAIRFNFNTAVYRKDYISAVSRMYDAIIRQIVENPSMSIASLRLTGEVETAQLLKIGNGVKQEWLGTVPELFSLHAFVHPSRVAVITEEGTEVTYGQLQKKIRNLSMILSAAGCTKGKTVGVHTGNTIYTIISIMAVFRTGGVYVPLDMNLPAQRLLHIIKDADIQIVLVQPGHQELLSGFEGTTIQADTDYDCPCMEDTSLQLQPDDIAYIIYTSGTTGLPKGVPIRHKSIVDRITYHNDYLDINPADKVLQFASVAFDASLVEIFMALTTGAAVILLPKACKENVELLKEKMIAAGVTTAIFPPAYLKLLGAEELPLLKTIISTGEAAILPDMLAHAQNRMVVNGYGPTESCVGASFHKVQTASAVEYQQRGALPIGKPFSNTQVYVTGHHRKLLPQGCAGEICIAGPGISTGYLNRDELTKEKFINNPFSQQEGYERMYCTGDTGYWNETGELEYEGRIDQQVQVRGIRIEPGEIEKLILQQDGITEALVIQLEIEDERRLIAYVQAPGDWKLQEVGIRSYLQDRLPAYMMPWKFIRLEKFPRTTNGKIDRNNLPVPHQEKNNDDIVLPATKAEQDLIVSLCSVMRKEAISMNRHFLELGGDSIKAIQLVSRLYRLGWKLELKDIFRYPVLSEMAACMQGVSQPADQRMVEGEVPLGPIQLDFFDRQFRHPHHFNQSILLQHKTRLDKEVIERILQKISQHHDALRMVYVEEAGTVKQFNRGFDVQPTVLEIDLRREENPAVALHQHAQQLQQNHDLGKGPLLKAAIFRMPENDRLLLVAHHLVVDGVSWRILLEDISALYEQSLNGQAFDLPPKTDSFKLWAQQLHEYAKSDDCRIERNYWIANSIQKNELLPLALTGLPEETRREAFELSTQQTQYLLTRVNHAYRTEVNDILLASLADAFSGVFGIDKIWIALEGHGRQGKVKADINRTVGWFTSIYPAGLDASKKNDTGMHIRCIKEQLRSVPEKGAGYGILKYINKEKEFVEQPSPQVLFNYLGQLDGEAGEAGFTLASENAGNNMHPAEKILYPIVITAMVLDEKLQLSCRYDASVVKPDTVSQLCENLKASLMRIVDHCRQRTHTQITPADLVSPIVTMDQLDEINKKYENLCGSSLADLYPLSPMQEGMLFHELLDNRSGAYIYQVSYRIRGKVDVQAVAQTAELLVKRHDILRTVFHFKNTDNLLQVVLANKPVEFSYHPLNEQGDTERRLKEFLQNDKDKAFDLEKDSLFRLAVLKVAADEYVFVWTCHHILMDGWCMGILISEFRDLYIAAVSQNASRLPQPVPFRNYIQWLLQSGREKALDYWTDHLQGYDSPVQLQHHVAEKEAAEYAAGLHVQKISAEQTKKLKELCYQCGATLYDCLQAVWGILLCKYNNTRDAVFGSIVSGRPPVVEGIERMMGLFINMIPVRVRYNPATLFASLVSEMRTAASEAEQYHYCSLAQLQSKTSLKNHALDHFIQQENYPVSQAIANNGGEMDWKISEVSGQEHTNYDFTLTIGDAEQTSFAFHFNNNVYPPSTVGLIAEHFTNLLAQVLEDRWIKVDALTLNTPAQLQQLLEWSEGSQQNYPAEKGFVSLFREKALQYPEHVAISDATTSWTYAQLQEAALAIASVLKNDHSLAIEEVVGISMERSVWMTAAILGTWMAGGAYLPLDPQLPEERIKFMMKDANVRLRLVAPSATSHLATTHCGPTDNFLHEVTDINVISTKGAPITNVPVALTQNNLAYVIYTSGSTGKPKGVMIEQGGMLNHMFNKIDALHIDEHSRVAQTAAIGFDISVWQLMCPLLAGAQIRIFSHAEVLQPEQMFESVGKENISHWQVSPVYLSELLSIAESRSTKASLPSLKYMIATGEALKPGLVKRWFDSFAAIPLVNAYGPTEASDDITHAILNQSPPNGRVPIGRPLNNMQVYVKDAFGQLCATGVPGEIYVSGAGVGRGYIGKPQHDNFITNNDHSLRTYRTGDWGMWLPDGNLYFIGRKDEQVKINGHRIEIGEIENTLSAAPGIAEAVVMAGKKMEQPAIIAYIQWQSGQTPDITSLKTWLKQRLTDYMIPAVFIELEKFPVTVNSKIDRAALPAVVEKEMKQALVEERPFTEKELALAAVWQQVLGTAGAGLGDDFFESGGDSIRAIQITSRLYTSGYKLAVQDIFDSPMMSDMAERLQPLAVEIEEPEIEPNPASQPPDKKLSAKYSYAEISEEDFSMINDLFN